MPEKDQETTFAEHLSPGQNIFVYFRFHHVARRFYRAVVDEVTETHVKLTCCQRKLLVNLYDYGRPERVNKLVLTEDGRYDPCLKGTWGLEAYDITDDNFSRWLGSEPYSGTVFLYPEVDIWAKYQSFAG